MGTALHEVDPMGQRPRHPYALLVEDEFSQERERKSAYLGDLAVRESL